MAAENHAGLPKVYLALGDSMSIDDYTGVVGGGAVSQFYKRLGETWALKDLTFDGCTMMFVPKTERGDIITLTIAGNDALIRQDDLLKHGVGGLLKEHLDLLQGLRERNAQSCLIVGNIYSPQTPLPETHSKLLAELNEGIRNNVVLVGGRMADIHGTFRGHETEYLCYDIEPNHQGATRIARLFEQEYQAWLQTVQ